MRRSPALYAEALSLLREDGDLGNIAIGLLNSAMVSIGRRMPDRAGRSARSASDRHGDRFEEPRAGACSTSAPDWRHSFATGSIRRGSTGAAQAQGEQMKFTAIGGRGIPRTLDHPGVRGRCWARMTLPKAPSAGRALVRGCVGGGVWSWLENCSWSVAALGDIQSARRKGRFRGGARCGTRGARPGACHSLPVKCTPPERWMSGLSHTPGKRA